jgi:hypothetical protein
VDHGVDFEDNGYLSSEFPSPTKAQRVDRPDSNPGGGRKSGRANNMKDSWCHFRLFVSPLNPHLRFISRRYEARPLR